LLTGHTTLMAGFAAQNNGCADDILSRSHASSKMMPGKGS